MNKNLPAFGVLFAVVLFTTAVQADPLPVGGTLFPAPAVPDVSGATLIAGGVAVPYTAATFTGTLTSSVYADDPNNPGGLTFTYLLTNSGPDSNDRLTVVDFTGFSTDAGYAVGAGVVPTSIDRTTADVVGYTFVSGAGPGPVNPGESSDLLIVRTNATQYEASMASVIDASVVSVASFGPMASVPEPASIIIFGLGAAGVLLAARRRRNIR